MLQADQNNIRYDIIFLRCVAVVAVVCYHFDFHIFRDGYAGVDVFFVLSGFLMTQIIGRKISNGHFSLVDFYYRRLARVVPALLTVLLFFFVLIYFVLGIKLYDFSRFAFSSSLFISNIHYYRAAGYFSPSSQLNFLLHTWSLSVEWQFYMLYPLFLLGAATLRRRYSHLFIMLVYVLLCLSFASMLYYMRFNPKFAFFMFPTRAWEFLVGGLAYFHGRRVQDYFSLRVRHLLTSFFIVLLVVSMLGLIRLGGFGWPSVSTWLPVGCTAGILLLAPELRFFKFPAIVYLARISYSWYLWHWPIVVLCTYFVWNQKLEQRMLFFLISLILGSIAYFLVERRGIFRKPAALIAGLFVTLTLTFSITQISWPKYLTAANLPEIANFQRHYTASFADAQYNVGKGHLLANSPLQEFDKNELHNFSDSLPNYLLLGDCHAGMFSATLRDLSQKHHVHLLQATGDETFPAPHVRSAYQGPTDLMHYMYDTYLPRHISKIDKVILSANYAGYSKKQLSAYLSQIDAFFGQYNVPIIYIGQTENYRIEYPVVEVLRKRFGVRPEKYLRAERYNANAFLKGSPIASQYIDVYNHPDIARADKRATYFYDADHLSIFGTQQYAKLLEERIFSTPSR
ncbi:acyltransferase family protein [Sphingobacterium paludis]|uniref:Peptidoglycan/LPS O-acetylase OafA/YrhL n=1 Tax=Sphingobacterium paludis TaxID=1476465 RepID=A0A4R7D8G5_9SPHI|nr:acyltransferase family protein [Sphingobacterium paludis]TDS16094.1 peptidoglycan/LPS O-acetylase OafA/YrhL [Sphingobacterium paludis]